MAVLISSTLAYMATPVVLHRSRRGGRQLLKRHLRPQHQSRWTSARWYGLRCVHDITNLAEPLPSWLLKAPAMQRQGLEAEVRFGHLTIISHLLLAMQAMFEAVASLAKLSGTSFMVPCAYNSSRTQQPGMVRVHLGTAHIQRYDMAKPLAFNLV